MRLARRMLSWYLEAQPQSTLHGKKNFRFGLFARGQTYPRLVHKRPGDMQLLGRETAVWN